MRNRSAKWCSFIWSPTLTQMPITGIESVEFHIDRNEEPYIQRLASLPETIARAVPSNIHYTRSQINVQRRKRYHLERGNKWIYTYWMDYNAWPGYDKNSCGTSGITDKGKWLASDITVAINRFPFIHPYHRITLCIGLARVHPPCRWNDSLHLMAIVKIFSVLSKFSASLYTLYLWEHRNT